MVSEDESTDWGVSGTAVSLGRREAAQAGGWAGQWRTKVSRKEKMGGRSWAEDRGRDLSPGSYPLPGEQVARHPGQCWKTSCPPLSLLWLACGSALTPWSYPAHCLSCLPTPLLNACCLSPWGERLLISRHLSSVLVSSHCNSLSLSAFLWFSEFVTLFLYV